LKVSLKKLLKRKERKMDNDFEEEGSSIYDEVEAERQNLRNLTRNHDLLDLMEIDETGMHYTPEFFKRFTALRGYLQAVRKEIAAISSQRYVKKQ
jgi:hypothetical protein